jgi:hypothetical protein
MLNRKERQDRRRDLREFVRSEVKNGDMDRRDAIRVMAATRFNPQSVDDVLDDLMVEYAEAGNTITLAANGERDWSAFLAFIKELLPLFIGLC